MESMEPSTTTSTIISCTNSTNSSIIEDDDVTLTSKAAGADPAPSFLPKKNQNQNRNAPLRRPLLTSSLLSSSSSLNGSSIEEIEENRKIEVIYIKALEESCRRSVEVLQNALTQKAEENEKLHSEVSLLKEKILLLESVVNSTSSSTISRYTSSLESLYLKPQMQQQQSYSTANSNMAANSSSSDKLMNALSSSKSVDVVKSATLFSDQSYDSALDASLLSMVKNTPSDRDVNNSNSNDEQVHNKFNSTNNMNNSAFAWGGPTIFPLSNSDEVNEFYQIGFQNADENAVKLSSLANETENKRLKSIILRLQQDLKKSSDDSDCFVLKAGERISSLEKALKLATNKNNLLTEKNLALGLLSSRIKNVGATLERKLSSEIALIGNPVSNNNTTTNTNNRNSNNSRNVSRDSSNRRTNSNNNTSSNFDDFGGSIDVSNKSISRDKFDHMDKAAVIQVYKRREDELVKALEGVINKCYLLSNLQYS